MALGILDTIGLAATLVFAIPVAIYGIEQLVSGETLFGVALLAVAAAMVLVPRYVTTPDDIPGKAAEKAVGSAVKSPEKNEEPKQQE
ncbi:hypothetical protein AUR64_06340 [Haloprofundus marisrubri]|uniref:Uncharacterized protein n=1 Tax=Haloprofundus marisrubri TaxID=1514971 RepID=A0A0W1RCA3_9EURY|nr:hypothetical protein [Haloprofundus marisrubri]KTG11048.1 hypothetical protein AUR64_06340 [Haloprofundus marisrubri]